MASWPTTLPGFSSSGYAIDPVDQCIATDMDGGNTRVRRRTTVKKDKIKVSWKMSKEQLEIFRPWFDSSSGANGGAAWFTVDLESGYTDAQIDARFIGPVSITPLCAGAAPHWIVSGTVEVRYA